jgi:SAM-dependent methyltransferase
MKTHHAKERGYSYSVQMKAYVYLHSDLGRLSMPKKATFVCVIALVGLVVAVWLFMGNPSNQEINSSTYMEESNQVQEQKEITIRNVTLDSVRYWIKLSSSDSEPMLMTIQVGDIDRFPEDGDMDVSFQRGEETISYRLDSGMPYSFRYNENDELELYEGSHGRDDAPDLAPFVPTPMAVVEKMLEMANIDKNDVLYDLGCGDGRIVITAAERYGIRGVGIDIDPQRIKEANAAAKKAGVENMVEFRLQDVMKVDFSGATVLALYLLEESNELMRPLFEKYLKPGTYVVSHNYPIPGWEKKEIHFASLMADDDEEHDIYLYRR